MLPLASPDEPDARAKRDLSIDALPDSGAVDLPGPDTNPLARPFGTPAPVPGINDPAHHDEDPSLTADMLEMFFTSFRAGGKAIFHATRDSVGAPWSSPIQVAAINTGYEYAPRISAHGLTLFFGRGTTDQDIWVTTRPSRDGAWTPPTEVKELNSDYRDYPGQPSADLLVLPLTSSRSSAMPDALFIATRDGLGQLWASPIEMPGTGVNQVGTRSKDPWISDDHLVLYFSSDRNNLDYGLWVTRRSSPGGDFAPPELVQELDSPVAEEDPWLSPDMEQIYFTRAQDDGGAYRLTIYHAQRLP